MLDCHNKHKTYIVNALSHLHTAGDIDRLRFYHYQVVTQFQHERLIHLIVTVTVGFALLLTTLCIIVSGQLILYPVAALLLALFVPYIVHYYRLENGTQAMYDLGKRIEDKYTGISDALHADQRSRR